MDSETKASKEPNYRLRQSREMRGWSQRRLAEELGTSEDSVSKWERGINIPDPHFRERLCELFDKNAVDLGFIKPLQQTVITGKSHPSLIPHSSVLSLSYDTDTIITSQIKGFEKSDYDTSPLSAKQELLRKLETRDWSVWAGLKLVQILKIISSYSGQVRPPEEVCEEIQTLLDQEIKILDDMMPRGDTWEAALISRHQALIMIAALPSTPQSMSLPVNAFNVEEFLPQCAASITACWHLLNEKGLAAVEEISATYLPMLMTLALHPSKYQIAAARLATMANMLRAIVAKHRVKDIERERYSHEAIRCSRFTGEKRLQAAALMTLGYTYLFCTPLRPRQAIEMFQEALSVLGSEISLIRSDIYIGLADAHAQCEEEQEALKCIILAQDYFPLHPEHDASFLYADCSLPVLYQWEGKMSLHLADYYPSKKYHQKAWDAFNKAAQIHLLHDRGTSEIIIDQADAARGIGELSLYTDYLQRGAISAVTLGSQRRYNEAYAVYQKAPDKWLSEKQFLLLARDIFGGQLPERE